MTALEQLTHDLVNLTDQDRQQVAELVRLLRIRGRLRMLSQTSADSLAAQYAEYDSEDSELAQAGMSAYADLVSGEDR